MLNTFKFGKYSVVNINFTDVLRDKLINSEENLIIILDGENTEYIKNIREKLKTVKSVFFIVCTDKITKYDEAKTNIKIITKVKKICSKLGISFGIEKDGEILIAGITDLSCKFAYEMAIGVLAACIADEKERYNFLYDKACEYLDNEFEKNNYCGFVDNRCAYVRENNYKDTSGVGCCHSYKLFRFLTVDFMYDHKPCEHIVNKRCNIECISCKFFTCDYLRKKGVKFRAKNLLLTDCFFSRKQKLVLQYNIFKTKEQIIEKLIKTKHSISPYFWFWLNRNYLIRP